MSSDEHDEQIDEAPDSGLELMEWDGTHVDLADALKERGRAYGSYVNTSRALPDVRDGLKPVQRRILYAMQLNGARHDRAYMKSAKTVGDTIGDWHPHGDSAVYEAMVRLAQDFTMSVPLVDGQGNWGTVGPKDYSDPAAAYRYTESRLMPIVGDWMRDLRPEIVDHRPNFAEKKQEPVVLPVTFPNVLVNGTKGIGWAMACEIPPHNLGEAIDAALVVCDKPEATLEQVMRALPAPDFPSGGVIVNADALTDAYATGQGTFQLQGKYVIENLPGNQQAVVITELPYGVSPDQIVAEVVRAARAEKIVDVTELPKNLTDKHGIRVVVKCKRGGNIQKLAQDLLQYTSLKITVGVNMTVLVDGKPRVVTLREALQHFVGFRLEVVTRRLEFERVGLHKELHRLLAMLAALDAIDAVVKIIRSAKDDDDARTQLCAKLKHTPHGTKKHVAIDTEQAQWILDMPLKRLNQLNRFDLEQDAKTKGDRIDEITAILESEDGVREIVKTELRDTKKRFGVPRRTLSGGAATAATGGDEAVATAGGVAVPGEPVWVFVGASGNAALAARKDGKLPSQAFVQVSAEQPLVGMIAAQSDQPLVAVSEQGQLFRLSLQDLPLQTKPGSGRSIAALARGDRLACATIDADADFYVFITEQGALKRVAGDIVTSAHAGGVTVFGVPAADRIVACVPHAAGDQLLIATADGKALRIELDKLRPVQTGSAGGVNGISLAAGDQVVGAVRATGTELVTLHSFGMGKRVPLTDYPLKGRGGGGVANSDPSKPSRTPAGLVATVATLADEADLLIATDCGTIHRVEHGALPAGTRAAVTKAVLTSLAPGEYPRFVVSLG